MRPSGHATQPTRKAWPQPSALTAADTTPLCSAKRIDRVQEIASEWKLSIDTVRLFANEPDVFVIQPGKKADAQDPYQVKERVWCQMINKRVARLGERFAICERPHLTHARFRAVHVALAEISVVALRGCDALVSQH